MAAPGGMCKLTLGVGPRAGASLKLPTHFQGQPFGVSSHGHADSHLRRSLTVSSVWAKRVEKGLMRVRVTNADSRKEKKNPQKNTEKIEAKIFFPSVQMVSQSSWLVYFGGCLLVLPGKRGS